MSAISPDCHRTSGGTYLGSHGVGPDGGNRAQVASFGKRKVVSLKVENVPFDLVRDKPGRWR